MIDKSGSQYKLMSRKLVNGKHKNIGTYTTRDAAKHREAQINYFKSIKK